MTTWVKEVVDYVINKGTADMHIMEKLFELIDMNKVKKDEDELSYVDKSVTMTFRRYVTDSDNYKVFMGQRHQKIEECLYHSTLCIILCDIKSDSYVCIEAGLEKTAKRFAERMYSGLKTVVFRNLYNHYYMSDIDFCNEGF